MLKRQLPTESQTRDALSQNGYAPSIPGRFLVAVKHRVDGLMDDTWAGRLGAQLQAHQDDLIQQEREDSIHWMLPNLMSRMPHLMADLRRQIMLHVTDACRSVHVPEFDLTNVTMSAHLHHHQCAEDWHDHVYDVDASTPDLSRRMSFDYFIHSMPKMFNDGRVEYMDGTLVEPEHNRLLFSHPIQKRRVQKVTCYSLDPLHGRWSIRGHLHGPAPKDYASLVKRLRCD